MPFDWQFEGQKHKILISDMYFVQYNFYPYVSVSNCWRLQENDINIW